MVLLFTSLLLLQGAVAFQHNNNRERVRVNLEAVVASVNSNPSSTWKASLYGDRTIEDFLPLLGEHSYLKKGKSSSSSTNFDMTKPPPAPSFDARKAWPSCPTISSIQDQGACGSCWAVAAAETFSDRMCIGSNGTFTAQLSAEKLMACDAACGPVGCDQGCQGGFLGDAWKYMATSGLPTEKCTPYTVPPCHHPCGDNTTTPACPGEACSDGEAYSVSTAASEYPFFSGNDLYTDLFKNGPIECSMMVYSDFPAYKSGVYAHTNGTLLGGHAVKLIGWDTDPATNTPYWILANSWNTWWGMDGFFYLIRTSGKESCGITENCWAGCSEEAKKNGCGAP